MIDKKTARIRRAAQTRRKIHEVNAVRLTVHRTNAHIYAQVYSPEGKVLISASTVEKEVRTKVSKGGNKSAAAAVGKRIAEKARGLGIQAVAFAFGNGSIGVELNPPANERIPRIHARELRRDLSRHLLGVRLAQPAPRATPIVPEPLQRAPDSGLIRMRRRPREQPFD